ncbi:hypothetical protein IK110_02950 [Candidatus Saccharibacteria bacterium]|nr:hypothetical protein [Candidatus Saccharibacteria bacterium]
MNQETQAAAPKKKSNAGIIVAIIVAALIIAGGITAAIIILLNNNGGGAGGNEPKTAQEAAKDGETSKPYESDSAYYVKIDGKKYTFESKLSDLEEAGYKVSSYVENKTVPAGKYMIMIGDGSLSNSDKGTSISITPYNDGEDDVLFPEAKLGKVTVSTSTLTKAQAEYEAMEFFGGIHLGSTREDLVKAFGEPTDTHEYENYKGGKYEKIEYKAKTWKTFEFKVEEGKVTEIVWTNYGGLNR